MQKASSVLSSFPRNWEKALREGRERERGGAKEKDVINGLGTEKRIPISKGERFYRQGRDLGWVVNDEC